MLQRILWKFSTSEKATHLRYNPGRLGKRESEAQCKRFRNCVCAFRQQTRMNPERLASAGHKLAHTARSISAFQASILNHLMKQPVVFVGSLLK
jgi:hypothetical protein